MSNITIFFGVEYLKADLRDFRQNSDQLLPMNTLQVAVDVPRDAEYFANLAAISLKEVSGEIAPAPILTPKGLAYVKKTLEAAFLEPKLVTEEDWSEIEKKANPESAHSSNNDDWSINPFKKAEEETFDVDKESW